MVEKTDDMKTYINNVLHHLLRFKSITTEKMHVCECWEDQGFVGMRMHLPGASLRGIAGRGIGTQYHRKLSGDNVARGKGREDFRHWKEQLLNYVQNSIVARFCLRHVSLKYIPHKLTRVINAVKLASIKTIRQLKMLSNKECKGWRDNFEIKINDLVEKI